MKTEFRFILYFAIAPLIGIVYIPILVILFFINETIRLAISLYLKQSGNECVKLVNTGSDAIWGYKKPSSSRNFLGYVVTQKGYATKSIVHKLFAHAFDYRDGEVIILLLLEAIYSWITDKYISNKKTKFHLIELI